jgi:hypothetical protein
VKRERWRRQPFRVTDARAMLLRVLATDGWTVGETPTGWWVRLEGEPVDGPHASEDEAVDALVAISAARDRRA